MFTATKRCFGAFARETRGNVALLFGLALIPVLLGVGVAVDYGRALIVRERMQAAADAAGLAIGSWVNLSQSEIRTKAQQYFDANFPPTKLGTVGTLNIEQSGNTFEVTVSGSVPTTFMKLANIDSVDISTRNRIVRNSNNVEVALALDTTGSMSGQRIIDLRAAAKDLIDLVVQDQQTPTYSKVALAPYSQAVNVGDYADDVRGPITRGKTIMSASRTNPVVITTSDAHGFSTNDNVYITGVRGMTALNNQVFKVTKISGNQFSLQGVNGTTSTYKTYTGGGTAFCTTPGCQYQYFQNPSGTWKLFEVTSCVTERTQNAYTDAPPSTTPLGRNYPSWPCPSGFSCSTQNPCISAKITPLSTNRAALKNAVDQLSAGGSTGGHIGVAWAWYLLSPKFGYLWPGESEPAPYGTERLLKVAVIMTDGEYNSVYCNGVIAKNSTSGSGSSNDYINCNAPNGSSFDQAMALCTAMKQAGVIVYTVGLDVVDDPRARNLVNNCATDADHVYLPANGTELKDAFNAIGREISELRIAQ